MEGQLESIFNQKKAPSAAPLQEPGTDISLSNELLFELQSTLEVERLVEIFFRHLQEVLPCQRLVYLHEEWGITLLLGENARHSAEYRLEVSGEYLGRIRLQRRRPFSEEELQQAEILMSALMLPVRNALRYRQAMKAAYVDPLTGLKNRRSYEDNLEREISRARRDGQPLGLMVVDIDWFKRINDEIGHLAGDQVLAEVARTLKENVRRSDMVFRYAGDEFVLLLPNIDPRCIRILQERLEQAVSGLHCAHGERALPVSVSIGAAILHDDMDGQQLFEAADLDMLCQKERRHRRSGQDSRQAG